MLKKILCLSTLMASGLPQIALAQDVAQQNGSQPVSVETVVVTGSRGQPRTATSSPSPIDAIGVQELGQLSGTGELRDALSQVLPSFQAQDWVGSSSWNSVIRPAGLRGLGGADVLVLVNGKRRHNSSLMDLSTGNLNNGANPVDLDLIPDSAIDHIEVLRDGASAQYGSDAIAGVINVILKKRDEGTTLSVTGGQRYSDQGASVSANGNMSFALQNGGSITLSLTLKDQDRATSQQPATGAFYYPVNGAPDPREATVNRLTYKGGLPQNNEVLLAENMETPLKDITIYNTGTLGVRHAWVGQSGRRPNATSDIPSVYPDGFTPFYALYEVDFQDTAGARGTLDGWNWDLSSTFGRDYTDNGSIHSLNASLGAASPTKFDVFSAVFDQVTTNLDFTRAFTLYGGSLQTSFGLEHRFELFATNAKDTAASQDGGYIYPSGPLVGQHAAVGAQGAIVVAPQDQASLSRNSFSGYVDLAYDITPEFFIGAAGRFEHYDDSAGDTVGGKLSTRYQIIPELAVRGTISNGFRAPSLPQEGFAQSAAQYTLVAGGYQFVQSRTVTVNSPLAQALGAKPLKPETSTNYSAGLVFTPFDSLTATIDAYQINLANRIARTGLLSGAGVNAILVANGFASNQSIQYFANAISTKTQGVDAVGSWTQDIGTLGNLKFSLGYNYNNTTIQRIANTPTQLAGLGLTLFDRASQGAVTVANPHTKIILGEEWSIDDWAFAVHETRYGSVHYLNNVPSTDQFYGARWLTDVHATYVIDKNFSASVGADNVFDVYPDLNTVPNTIGLSPYATISPFGSYGGFYYLRLTYNQ